MQVRQPDVETVLAMVRGAGDAIAPDEMVAFDVYADQLRRTGRLPGEDRAPKDVSGSRLVDAGQVVSIALPVIGQLAFALLTVLRRRAQASGRSLWAELLCALGDEGAPAPPQALVGEVVRGAKTRTRLDATVASAAVAALLQVLRQLPDLVGSGG